MLVGVFDRETFRSSRGQQIGGGDTRGGDNLWMMNCYSSPRCSMIIALTDSPPVSDLSA